jgi:hypothetical protein
LVRLGSLSPLSSAANIARNSFCEKHKTRPLL